MHMQTGKTALANVLSAGQAGIRTGAVLGLFASLIWFAQAALIATLLAGLLAGDLPVSPLFLGGGYLGLAGLRALIASSAEKTLFNAAERVVTETRRRLWVQETRRADAVQGGPGAIAALAQEKLDALIPYLTRYAPAQIRVRVIPLLILAIAFWHSWAVGLVLLMAGPLIPVFMALVGWAAQQASERQMVEIGQLNDLLVDRLAALSDIRLLDATQPAIAGFENASHALRHRTMVVLRIAFLSSTVLELFSAIGVAMVAVWVGFALLGEVSWGTWGSPVTPWAGIYLLLLAPEFFQPLRDLAAAWHDRAGALAVAQELAQREQGAGQVILGTGAVQPRLVGSAEIAMTDLSVLRNGQTLRYPDITLPAGATVAVTGPSGAGKTTLLRLLAGLERPATGQISVAGQILTDDTADGWRAGLGWMPQRPHFLNQTLAQNIGFGQVPEADILKRAGLGSVLATLPQGLNTVLGETGAGLSGGEARRAMLARAMQAHPLVLLADEPTADLDAETAETVMQGMLELAATGCTLIVATHDPALIARMAYRIDLPGAGGAL